MASTVDIMNLTHGWVFGTFSALLTDTVRGKQRESVRGEDMWQRSAGRTLLSMWLKLIQSIAHFFFIYHILQDLVVGCWKN